jgi:hypothetical protein
MAKLAKLRTFGTGRVAAEKYAGHKRRGGGRKSLRFQIKAPFGVIEHRLG